MTSTSYTQSSGSLLEMRLANSEASDLIALFGGATLDGVLSLSGTNLDADQTWTLITTFTGIANDFAFIDWPEDGTWDWVVNPYQVTKVA